MQLNIIFNILNLIEFIIFKWNMLSKMKSCNNVMLDIKSLVFCLLLLLLKQWADILEMKIVIVMMNYEMRRGLPRRQPSRHQEIDIAECLVLNILYHFIICFQKELLSSFLIQPVGKLCINR